MSRAAPSLPRRTVGLHLALLVAAGALAAGATQVQAGERTPVVIELYTSQGCASCQPASRVLGEFAREPGVIALTFPITYWDYLGWKDVYAQPAFTARQRAYASLRGERQVFTPQAIVNGEPSMIRSDRNSLAHKFHIPIFGFWRNLISATLGAILIITIYRAVAGRRY